MRKRYRPREGNPADRALGCVTIPRRSRSEMAPLCTLEHRTPE
jgi:hypothetical protein